MLLPTEISLLLPQHDIKSKWLSALGLAYADIGEARRTGLLSCYKRKVSVFSWGYNLILVLLVFKIEF